MSFIEQFSVVLTYVQFVNMTSKLNFLFAVEIRLNLLLQMTELKGIEQCFPMEWCIKGFNSSLRVDQLVPISSWKEGNDCMPSWCIPLFLYDKLHSSVLLVGFLLRCELFWCKLLSSTNYWWCYLNAVKGNSNLQVRVSLPFAWYFIQTSAND